ncbi:tRNA-dihydrouridine synthase, partial [Hansschlegelia beijingensis]
MMDWTDRNCRLFHRALTGQALLYTEMVTTGAVRFGPRERLLGFSPEERQIKITGTSANPIPVGAFQLRPGRSQITVIGHR